MADDERKRTDQLRSVEIDALLRRKQDGHADRVEPGDATAQIRPADLRRLEQATTSAEGIPNTEKNEAIHDGTIPHATERMEHVRPTQQSGHLRAVLDQDLREVVVEPIRSFDSEELAAVGPSPATDRIDLVDQNAAVQTQPFSRVLEPTPGHTTGPAPAPTTGPTTGQDGPSKMKPSAGAGVALLLGFAAVIALAVIAALAVLLV